MTEAEMANVDMIMDSQYAAKRSCVTNNEWIKTGVHCWVCAYAHTSEDPSKYPTLYMCHWARGAYQGVLVVYKAMEM
jgi:hypothetical protein